MANITLSYKGQSILQMNASGTKILKTAGKYCEADIVLTYINHGIRADPVATFSMGDFLAEFEPVASAVEVTE